MASLRRLDNSPYWIACITLPGGMRTNRSTKLTDRGTAQKLADEWENASRRAEQGRFAEPQARAVLNDILVKIGEEPIACDTTDAFLRRWLAGKKTTGTAKRYGCTIDAFLSHLNGRHAAPIAAITYRDMLAFIDARQQEGVAAKTLLVDVRTLGAAFNLARKLGLITSNPVERALALQPIASSPSKRAAFTKEQVSALLAAALGEWRTMVLVGYYTGARLGDCARMRWENVRLDAGVIDYQPQKKAANNGRVVIPIHPKLRAHLDSLPRTGAFLCPSLAAMNAGGRNGLSAEFKRTMVAAGICGEPGALSFHSLRHAFNSTLANAGVAQETRMALTGHRCAAVNDGYTHLDLPLLKTAIEKLPNA